MTSPASVQRSSQAAAECAGQPTAAAGALNRNLADRLARALRLLAEAETIMASDGDNDEGAVRSLTNDIRFIRNRIADRLRETRQ